MYIRIWTCDCKGEEFTVTCGRATGSGIDAGCTRPVTAEGQVDDDVVSIELGGQITS